jgi:hypothetical protein
MLAFVIVMVLFFLCFVACNVVIFYGEKTRSGVCINPLPTTPRPSPPKSHDL